MQFDDDSDSYTAMPGFVASTIVGIGLAGQLEAVSVARQTIGLGQNEDFAQSAQDSAGIYYVAPPALPNAPKYLFSGTSDDLPFGLPCGGTADGNTGAGLSMVPGIGPTCRVQYAFSQSDSFVVAGIPIDDDHWAPGHPEYAKYVEGEQVTIALPYSFDDGTTELPPTPLAVEEYPAPLVLPPPVPIPRAALEVWRHAANGDGLPAALMVDDLGIMVVPLAWATWRVTPAPWVHETNDSPPLAFSFRPPFFGRLAPSAILGIVAASEIKGHLDESAIRVVLDDPTGDGS